MTRTAATGLRGMLDARSVAIVGASSDPKKIGFRPVDYLLRVGYTGSIYPVNPRMERLGDLPCYPSLGALPEVPDLVAVVVAAGRTEAVVREAAELGVPAALVITSGFGEIDADGAALERTLAGIARDHGMLLVGPNSVGVIHTPNRLAVTFSEALSRGTLTRTGGIGIVSQSGAFGTVIFALARDADLGLRSYVSTGNEAAYGVGDFLGGLLEDPEIRAVGGYIETIRDGAGFVRTARRAAELGKPIVLVKVGASEAGRSAASSHTGAIAGNDDAYAAAFRRLGIVRAEDERHLLGTLDTFDTWYRLPRGRRVAVVSMSGGAGVLLSDDLDRRGVALARFPDALVEELRAMLPAYAAVQNPVDITGQFVTNDAGLKDVLEAIADSDAVDAVLLFAGIGWTSGGAWAHAVVEATRAAAPIMVVTQFAPEESRAALRAGGVPVFESPIDASRVLSSVLEWTTAPRFGEPDVPRDLPPPPGPNATEAEAKAMLAAAGIVVPRGFVATTADEAASLAAGLGSGPLVVKAQGPGLEHKTDAGAVELSVAPGDVLAACEAMADRVGALGTAARIEGFLVEEMAGTGVDLAVGAVWEEPFGHLVMVGLGGTAVEVLGDVAFGLAPMGVDEAAALIRSLRAFPLLDGHRGAPPMDVEALAEAVAAISALCAAAGPSLRELDVNPIRVLPRGQGVVALDALVVSQAR